MPQWYERAGSGPLEQWPQMGGKEMTMHSEWTSPERRNSESRQSERLGQKGSIKIAMFWECTNEGVVWNTLF